MSAPFAPAALAPAAVSTRTDTFLPAIGYQPETPAIDQWQASREIRPLFAGVAVARFLPLDPAMWVELAERIGMSPIWSRARRRGGRIESNSLFTRCNTDYPDIEAFLNGWRNTASRRDRRRLTAWLRRREMLRARDRRIEMVERQMESLLEVAGQEDIDMDERATFHADAVAKAEKLVAMPIGGARGAAAKLATARDQLPVDGDPIVETALEDVIDFLTRSAARESRRLAPRAGAGA